MDLGKDKTVGRIISRLKAANPGDGPVKVEGSWWSFAPLLAGYISEKLNRPILYICSHLDDADNVGDDLGTFTNEHIETFPAWEAGQQFTDATDEIGIERLRIALGLAELKKPGKNSRQPIISASVLALCQGIPSLTAIKKSSLRLQIEQEIPPEDAISWLIEKGFERVDRVDLPGQFARRGGIIDIYAPMATQSSRGETADKSCDKTVYQGSTAFRIEFFGDNIASIRTIDLDTQRSSEQIDAVKIIPPRGPETIQGQTKREKCVCGPRQTELFIKALPEDTIIILEEPTEIEEVANIFLDRSEQRRGLFSWSDIYKAIGEFVQLHICRFATADKSEFLKLDVKSTQRFEHKAGPVWAGNKAAIDQLVGEARQGRRILLYCENAAEGKRITEIITETHKHVPVNLELPVGFIHQGFIINSLNTIVVSHHEIFGQCAIRRRIRAVPTTSPVEGFLDLQKGSYVVHVSHGIGKFLGIKTIRHKAGPAEYLTIEYADKAIIHVPVQNIGLVQKYVGTMSRRPRLSKIGSKKWQRQKEKVARAVRDLAGELLELQAERESTDGIDFDEDSTWQKEFEESFPYQETEDQITVMEQLKADMLKPVPMDRLLCGDVGYGKTELAMRAAFKAVDSGRQVAVLVPTTVLCIQHGRTFTERFADFPVCIETLNRFVPAKKAKDIIVRSKQGKVDILIGTHRLLSSDIGFKDLGLLIIDEEQRFGVEHKERLKRLRVNVDVLTMTATPIPRTLHFSMLGIRDISSLATPPLDRRSIVTTVTRYDRELIKKAIIRELNRQGQIFFLHNRVKTIAKMADEIRKLAPDAGIAVAHGRMAKHELEEAMIRFVLGEIDVLVCTTIIESGLDIPNANTILINNADLFGLAELHQLRGRVGRYKHRAYAYMLTPTTRPITPVAAKRLKAIEEYSQLGAGFRIALRDLEIRGAGNILGAEQSGHIHAVGYEMYCKLLAEAVKRLKNQHIEAGPATVVDLGFTTYIPKNYVPADRQRMDVYRRLAAARTEEDLKQLESDLKDLFGPVPEEVELLLQWADVRIRAGGWNIKSIVASGCDLIFSFETDDSVGELFAKAPGIVRVPDPETVYVRLEKNYFEPGTLLSVLRKILRTA